MQENNYELTFSGKIVPNNENAMNATLVFVLNIKRWILGPHSGG
jgi:hypothetical protein